VADLPQCRTCRCAPIWMRTTKGLLFGCACNGMTVDYAPGTPPTLVELVKAEVETHWRGAAALPMPKGGA